MGGSISKAYSSGRDVMGRAAGFFANEIPRYHLSYQYQAEDIQALLGIAMSTYPSAHILAAVDFSDEQGSENTNLQTTLAEFLSSGEGRTHQAMHMFLPILVNNAYWVGVCLIIEPAKQPLLVYFNSLLMNRDCIVVYPDLILSVVNNVLEAQSRLAAKLVKPGLLLKQFRVHDCGPYLVENMLRYMSGDLTEESQNTGSDVIRHAHVNLLQQHRPDYAPDFIERQNKTTVPMSTVPTFNASLA